MTNRATMAVQQSNMLLFHWFAGSLLWRALCNAVAKGVFLVALLQTIGAFLIVSDPLPDQPADALVPLAGDPARVRAAVGLLQQEQARWLLITNMYIPNQVHVNPRNVYSTRTSREAVDYGANLEQIFASGQAVKTTYQEIQVIRQFAEQQGWQSLIIVTSASHTRRTRLIVDEVFVGAAIRVAVHPFAADTYAAASWWKHRQGRTQTCSEYLKLLAYLVGYRR